MACQAETQAKEGKKMRQEINEATIEVNRLSKTGKNLSKFKQEDSKNTSLQKERTCGRCEYPNHIQGRKCPASRSTCRGCKKEGHLDRYADQKEYGI